MTAILDGETVGTRGHGPETEGFALLGLSRHDAARLAGAVHVEDARVLIEDVGCPPSLAADILLFASDLGAAGA